LLHGADQLLSGKLLYKDFWEFYPPGGFLITEIWMRVFGQSLEFVRGLGVLIVLGTACFSYLACLSVSGDVLLAIVLTVYGMMATRMGSIAIIHHMPTTMLSVAAAWFSLASIQRKQHGVGFSILAGLAAGTAAMITSTRGMYAVLAILATFVEVKRFRAQMLASFVACLVAPVVCLFYIILNGEFVSVYDDIVRFTLSSYSSIQGVPWGMNYSWLNGTKDLYPLVGLLTVLTVFRTGGKALASTRLSVRLNLWEVKSMAANR
jgi:hypothetical protein